MPASRDKGGCSLCGTTPPRDPLNASEASRSCPNDLVSFGQQDWQAKKGGRTTARFRNKMSTSEDSFDNFLKIYNETIVLQLASQVTATAVDELCSAASEGSEIFK